MGKKKEFKLRIIKRKIIDWELYVVQVFRKFLWWEWWTDVKSYEYKSEAILNVYKHLEENLQRNINER